MIEFILDNIAAFSCGLVVGGSAGVLVMCLCFTSSRGSICDDCDLVVKMREEGKMP